jgi:predicted phage-related endonuclease
MIELADCPAIERRPITSRAEWLAWRLVDVTASDVPALFGVDAFQRTALSVWAEKTGMTGGVADTPTLRRGRWGEAAVIEMLGEERPDLEIRRAKVYLRDPSIRIGATPDAGAIDPEREGMGVVQCKTVNERAFERYWIDGRPPLAYQLQLLTEMMLSTATWGVIAALIMDSGGGWEPLIYEVKRHPAAEARIRDAVVGFWSNLDAGLMPAVNPAEDAETVAAMFPKALKPAPVDLSGDNALAVELVERARLKAEIKVADKRCETIETGLKLKLGVNASALVPGWKVTWKNEHHKEYTVAAQDRRVLRINKEA